MSRRNRLTRAASRLDARRLAHASAVTLGGRVRDARRRRRWSLRQLGERVGLTAARLSQIERAGGAGAPLEVWYALGQALGLPFQAAFARDKAEEPFDAGHLGIQDLALRLGRITGRSRSFELPTRPADPSLSIDVGLRDDARRLLIIEECWNTFGNINASVRSTRRKIAEAEDLAVAAGGDAGPFRVAACWIVRDTRRNREIVGRYPDVFASTFPGSSRQWVAALTRPGVSPPEGLGLVWCDLRARRLFAWRKPS